MYVYFQLDVNESRHKISMTNTAVNYLELSASCLLALNIEARGLPEAESAVAQYRLRTENPGVAVRDFTPD